MSKPGQLVLVALRKMIASGELAAGERLMEIPTAQLFGVSRMPVRMAFRTLEEEGLLVPFGGRGYQVRSVSPSDIAGAVEVRGVLEGLAARQTAELGLSNEARAALERCLVEGDQLFEKGYVTEDDLEVYHDLNMRFHQVIVEGSHNPAIADALARNDHLPFASVTALAVGSRGHGPRVPTLQLCPYAASLGLRRPGQSPGRTGRSHHARACQRDPALCRDFQFSHRRRAHEGDPAPRRNPVRYRVPARAFSPANSRA